MAADFASDQGAGDFARKIYDTSEKCYMAHSIRAVEHFLREQYSFDTQIILVFDKNVRSDMNRMSYCSAASDSGDPSYVFIQDDPEWDHNKRRFCIAHELYHILWSAASSADIERTARVESVCDVFANGLCGLHDDFYDLKKHPEHLGRLKFQGLPYRSV